MILKWMKRVDHISKILIRDDIINNMMRDYHEEKYDELDKNRDIMTKKLLTLRMKAC